MPSRTWTETWDYLVEHCFGGEGAKWERSGHSFVCRCPLHDDHNPSFLVTKNEETGLIVGHCRSNGCNTVAAFGAFGVTALELRRDRHSNVKSSEEDHVVATFIYRDQNGNELFERRRTAGKDFFPYRQIADGQWACGLSAGWYYRGNGGIWFRRKDQSQHNKTDKRLPAVRTVPYRADQLLQSRPAGIRVLFVEGEGDADNLQELLGDDYVVTTLPTGALKSPGSKAWRDEFLEHFRDRHVTIFYDRDKIGPDGTGPGQVHAQIVAQKLSSVAASVSVVDQDVSWGGKDVSDWIDAGATREEILSLVESATPWTDGCSIPGSVPEAVDPTEQQQMLAAFGIEPLGVTTERKLVVWSSARCCMFDLSLYEIAKFSRAHLVMISSLERVTRHLCTGDSKSVPEQWWLREIADAITEGCASRKLDSRKLKGIGVWRVGRSEEQDSLVLVNGSSMSALNGTIERLHSPIYGGETFRPGDGPDWFNHDRLQDGYREAANASYRQQAVDDLRRLIELWTWRQKTDPVMVCGCILATWLQTVWLIRPQPSIIGGSDSGKSRLADTMKTLFGDLGLKIDRPSEPGMRESAMGHAYALMADEFDRCRDQDRKAILELRRLSTSGSIRPLGTGTGRARWYQLWYMIWLFSIDSALGEEADVNRALVFELVAPKPEDCHLDEKLPAESVRRDIGFRCFVGMLNVWRECERLFNYLVDSKAGGVSHRMAQIHAVPVACYAAMSGADDQQAMELFQVILGERGDSSVDARDVDVLIDDILSYNIRIERNEYTVSAIADSISRCDPLPDTPGAEVVRNALGTKGAAVVEHDFGSGKEWALFIRPRSVEAWFRNHPRWGGVTIREYLDRVPGSHAGVAKVCKRSVKGILLPLGQIM